MPVSFDDVQASVAHLRNNHVLANNIITYCSEKYSEEGDDRAATLVDAKNYASDALSAVGDDILVCSDNLARFVLQQTERLERATDAVDGAIIDLRRSKVCTPFLSH